MPEFVVRIAVGHVVGICVGLAVFGVSYNYFVDWLEKKGHQEGNTAELVVIGVAVTLLGLLTFSWQAAALTLLLFACSGLPMWIGSRYRNNKLLKQLERTIRNDKA